MGFHGAYDLGAWVMDRRIAFWKSALYANVSLKLCGMEWVAVRACQLGFAEEVAFANQYDKVFFYRNN